MIIFILSMGLGDYLLLCYYLKKGEFFLELIGINEITFFKGFDIGLKKV